MKETEKKNIIAGGGPAGLSAAYYLVQKGEPALILEKNDALGGLSRTVLFKGFRFDIGPHRFFSKNKDVTALWEQTMGEDFLKIPRLTRIFYKDKLFYYPLRPANALFGLGMARSVAIMASLLVSKISPRMPEKSFEDWVSNRFGKELYRIFFKTYTEKVWGIPCNKISSDWASQRIKNLSLVKALMQAFGFGKTGKVTSLIEEFNYPKLGAGQLYERIGDKVKELGGEIAFRSCVQRVSWEGDRITSVAAGDKEVKVYQANALFSSMPLTELVQKMDPAPPEEVLEAANSLRFRSLVTANFIIGKEGLLKDNWIYIHSPDVVAGRLQFYKNWGPGMIPEKGKSSVSLEYFTFEDESLWKLTDEEVLDMGRKDLKALGLPEHEKILDGMVIRYSKAYPVYDEGYSKRVDAIKGFLGRFKNLYVMGRYGQFRYNNMDHSITTAYLAVRRHMGEKVDPWSVNEDAEYHEEK